jgi:hypothetical protein
MTFRAGLDRRLIPLETASGRSRNPGWEDRLHERDAEDSAEGDRAKIIWGECNDRFSLRVNRRVSLLGGRQS